MKRVYPGGKDRSARPTSAAYIEDATRLPPVPASPSPTRSPATPLPFNHVDPFLDPVRWQNSRFHLDNDEDARAIPHRAPGGFAVPVDGQARAPCPDGVANPRQVQDLDKTVFTWDQLGVDLQDCEFDIDTIIAPLYAKSFHQFSEFWILAGKDTLKNVHNNFPAGMVITLDPWVVILTMELPNIPGVNRTNADALHAAAKLLCDAIGEFPTGAKINIQPMPDNADVKSSCLTRSHGQLVHADRLSFAFKKLQDSLEFDATFQLFICRYNLKAAPEVVYAPLMCMYATMRMEGDGELEEMYRRDTVLHVGVDFLTSSGYLVLAKAYKLKYFLEGHATNFRQYRYIGKLGDGFGGSTSTVKEIEKCKSLVSGYTQYMGALKRFLLAVQDPARKWLGLNNDEKSIVRLQPEFQAWKEGLQVGGQAQRIAGARLEVYTTCSMRNWPRHKSDLLPIFTKLLKAMDFKLVRVSDYFHQFKNEYELAISLGCFQKHGDSAGSDPAEHWKQLGCQRLRMLAGWAYTSENECAYYLHRAGVHFKDLEYEHTNTGVEYIFPKNVTSKPQSLEDLMHGYETEDEPQQRPVLAKHVFDEVPDGLFALIGFPMLIQQRKTENSMNRVPIPELSKWNALVEALSAPGGMLRGMGCTGQQLQALAAQVQWRGPCFGRGSCPTDDIMGWACKYATSPGGSNKVSGTLGRSLGEATVNLWMKMRGGTFTPLKKV